MLPCRPGAARQHPPPPQSPPSLCRGSWGWSGGGARHGPHPLHRPRVQFGYPSGAQRPLGSTMASLLRTGVNADGIYSRVLKPSPPTSAAAEQLLPKAGRFYVKRAGERWPAVSTRAGVSSGRGWQGTCNFLPRFSCTLRRIL